jgi:hypothetical protein
MLSTTVHDKAMTCPGQTGDVLKPETVQKMGAGQQVTHLNLLAQDLLA